MFYNEKEPKVFKGKLILGQCPHHGAGESYKNAFWKLIRRDKNTPIVISVGHNNYGHPSEKVLLDLIKNNYNIYSTNEVGAISKTKITLDAKETIIHLQTFGEFVPALKTDKLKGDKIFEIDSVGTVIFLN